MYVAETITSLHLLPIMIQKFPFVCMCLPFVVSCVWWCETVVLVALAVGAVTDRLTLSRDESKVLEFIENIRNKQV